MLKNGVELNFRPDGIAVALTALQLQWELATRMTFVNETRPFRCTPEGYGALMNINISAFKNKNLRLIVDTAIGLTAKGLECNCKLYSIMSVDCRFKAGKCGSSYSC